MQLTYTSTGQTRERARRKRLVEAMGQAVEWYHQASARGPGGPRRARLPPLAGLSGDVARTFKLGWAPDDWDALARHSGIDGELLRATGLAFTNRRDRMQDAFRARVLFPIFSDSGEAVAIGGRVLPGSTDPAKYKNSPETPIYAKSKTLYGLNWSKADIANSDQVVVCEGYTDVIGFHRVGVRTGGGDVRHGVHRGSRAAAQALRQPGGAGVRRRRRRSGRRRALLRVGAALSGAGVRRPTARRTGSRRAGATRSGGARRRGRRRRAVPRLPPAAGDGRPPGAHAGGPGQARRAGDERRQRAPRQQRAQAVRRPGGVGGRAAGRRSRVGRRATGEAADASPSSRRGGPRSARTPSSSPSPCSPRTGSRSPGGWSRSCSTTRRTAGRSSRSPTPAATSWRRSSGPIPRRGRCSSGQRSPTSTSIRRPRRGT